MLSSLGDQEVIIGKCRDGGTRVVRMTPVQSVDNVIPAIGSAKALLLLHADVVLACRHPQTKSD